MKITIAGQDYTSALDAIRPLTIDELNAMDPRRLRLPGDGSLRAPTGMRPTQSEETIERFISPDTFRPTLCRSMPDLRWRGRVSPLRFRL